MDMTHCSFRFWSGFMEDQPGAQSEGKCLGSYFTKLLRSDTLLKEVLAHERERLFPSLSLLWLISLLVFILHLNIRRVTMHLKDIGYNEFFLHSPYIKIHQVFCWLFDGPISLMRGRKAEYQWHCYRTVCFGWGRVILFG
jgi:hypothetical protein